MIEGAEIPLVVLAVFGTALGSIAIAWVSLVGSQLITSAFKEE